MAHLGDVERKYEGSATGPENGSQDSHLKADAGSSGHSSDTDADSYKWCSHSDSDSDSESDCWSERPSSPTCDQEASSKDQANPSSPSTTVAAQTVAALVPPKATYGGLGRRWLPAAEAFHGKWRNKNRGIKKRSWYGLSCKYDDDFKVGVKVHPGARNNIGKITNVPLRYSEEQLQEWFVSQGVIHARRQVLYQRKADNRVERVPTFNVILTFRPDKIMPTTVVPKPEVAKYLGDRPFVVRPHFEPPVQCMICQRFGHMARYCLRTPRCKVCSGPHSYKNCNRRDRPKCANCHGPHAATFTRCPLRRLAAVERRWSHEGIEDD
ncbi:hypothetical protein HPB50_002092 [Hyalomma asiaticum]|uniref:Uncharacterized protein n=1 Tax=Hyalomma asiaticum TaxID=266040 RepID=A0ACB7RGG5_HYAAI|nr:hypothetical protein HPB50_002092 [Hyalomma asiaticum]